MDDLFGDLARVEVGHKAFDLAVLDLQYADAAVLDGPPVGGAGRRPLQGGVTFAVGEHAAELALHLVERLAVIGPELPELVVTLEGPGHRDVPGFAVVRVDLDQRLDVPVLLEFPQSIPKPLRYLPRQAIPPPKSTTAYIASSL